MGEFIVLSQLRASAEEVWARTAEDPTARRELPGFLRLQYDDDGRARQAALRGRVALPTPVGRVRLRLFGLVTLLRADLDLCELQPGKSWLIRARTRGLIRIEHERAVEPRRGTECTLTDRLVWEPRPGTPEALVRIAVQWLYTKRHHRLLAWFGAGTPSAPRRG